MTDTQEMPAIEENPDPPPLVPVPPARKNVFQMISEVTKMLCERGGVSKDQENTYDKYKFRGIDQVYDALAPIISKVGLVIIPEMTTRDMEIREAKSGGKLHFVTVNMKYTLYSNEDGSSVVVTVPGEAMDRGDKATNKALSAAYKYMCFQVFCIPLEGTDTEAETYELGKNNSTGRAPESVAKTAARESGAPMTDILSNSVSTIQMAVFNDDASTFYEAWDELSNDEKVAVYGAFDRDTRKQCKAWQDERKANESS